jgi:Protein of unknown function (DUF998)
MVESPLGHFDILLARSGCDLDHTDSVSNRPPSLGCSCIDSPIEGVVMSATSNTSAATSIGQPRTLPVSTRILLIAGAVAGPLFAVLATGQVLLRDGYDLRRHPLSLLATGGLGFVQISNFVIAGVGVLCLAVAVRRTITDGVGRRLLAPLIAVFGLGLIASGVFVMDAENGFPIGTPEGPAPAMSWHGIAHVVAATVAFTGLAAACIVLTVRMVRRRAGWAAVLNACAALVLLAPINPGWASIQLAVTALVGFTWTSALAVWLLRSLK